LAVFKNFSLICEAYHRGSFLTLQNFLRLPVQMILSRVNQMLPDATKLKTKHRTCIARYDLRITWHLHL